MKLVITVGKALSLLFWGVVLANLAAPFAQPFAPLLYLAGAAIAMLHAAELLAFKARWSTRPQPALQAVQVMVFGIFHLLSLPTPEALPDVPSYAAPALEVEHA